MPKLSDFKRIKHIEFRWPDSEETLNLWIQPDNYTGKNLQLLEGKIKEAENSESDGQFFLCLFLSELIERWDLTDDSDATLALTAESLFEDVPITLILALLNRIQQAMSVDPMTPKS